MTAFGLLSSILSGSLIFKIVRQFYHAIGADWQRCQELHEGREIALKDLAMTETEDAGQQDKIFKIDLAKLYQSMSRT